MPENRAFQPARREVFQADDGVRRETGRPGAEPRAYDGNIAGGNAQDVPDLPHPLPDLPHRFNVGLAS
jgi:hypothetical protein